MPPSRPSSNRPMVTTSSGGRWLLWFISAPLGGYPPSESITAAIVLAVSRQGRTLRQESSSAARLDGPRQGRPVQSRPWLDQGDTRRNRAAIWLPVRTPPAQRGARLQVRPPHNAKGDRIRCVEINRLLSEGQRRRAIARPQSQVGVLLIGQRNRWRQRNGPFIGAIGRRNTFRRARRPRS